jgi:hypothetical protein
MSAQKAAEEPTDGHAVEDQPAELEPGEKDPEQEREEHPEQRSLAEADEGRATGRHAAGHLLHEAQPAADDRDALDGEALVGQPVDRALGGGVTCAVSRGVYRLSLM